MTILLALLTKYWPQVALAALALTAWGYADELWCNAPCRRAKAAGEACEAKVVAAQKRATDLANLYADTLGKIDAAVRQQKETDRVVLNAALSQRAQALPAAASVHLSDGAVRLFVDASAAANPRPAAVDQGPTVAVPASPEGQQGGGTGDAWFSERELGQFAVDAAFAYRDAFRKWDACVQAYAALQHPEEKP